MNCYYTRDEQSTDKTVTVYQSDVLNKKMFNEKQTFSSGRFGDESFF